MALEQPTAQGGLECDCGHTADELPVFRWRGEVWCTQDCMTAHGLALPYSLGSPDAFGVRPVLPAAPRC